jgi:hypothetical protein
MGEYPARCPTAADRHYAWAPFLNELMNAERFEGFSGTLQKRDHACRVLPLAHSLRRGGTRA